MCITNTDSGWYFGVGGWFFIGGGCPYNSTSFTWMFFCPSFCYVAALASAQALDFCNYIYLGMKMGQRYKLRYVFRAIFPKENQEKLGMCIWLNSASSKKYISSVSASFIAVENEHLWNELQCLSTKFLFPLEKKRVLVESHSLKEFLLNTVVFQLCLARNLLCLSSALSWGSLCRCM